MAQTGNSIPQLLLLTMACCAPTDHEPGDASSSSSSSSSTAAETDELSSTTGSMEGATSVGTTGMEETRGHQGTLDDSTGSEGAPVCGNGILEPEEICDDGNSNDADGCTVLCMPPSCDDGIVSGGESDVDCGGDCEACTEGAACQVGEDCATLACLGGACGYASSCAELHEVSPELENGIYWIDPGQAGTTGPFEAYCDMSHDDGGWTLVMVSSNDGTDTWTWNNRDLMANDPTTVGAVDALNYDFKSRAYNEVIFDDMMFLHAPSGVWAEYDNVGGGVTNLGSFVGAIPAPQCYSDVGSAGYVFTAGTMGLAGGLCDRKLYFNVGDHEGGVAGCMSVDSNNDTYGPVWNIDNNSGCDLDDPSLVGLGPSRECPSCTAGHGDREHNYQGFGSLFALDLNWGVPGLAENYMQVFVR